MSPPGQDASLSQITFPTWHLGGVWTTNIQQTINEGNKSTNVDIRMMQGQVQRCQAILQELLLSEEEAICRTSLTHLSASMESHGKTLTKKIDRLSESQHQVVPSSLPEMSPCGSENVVATSKQIHVDIAKDDGGNAPHKMVEPTRHDSDTASGSQNSSIADDITTSQQEGNQCRQKAIESTIASTGQVKFVDVIGLQEAKQSLYDAVITPLMFPHLFTGGFQPWQRILLYGPPGTGKSYLAQAVASEVEATFYRVSSTDLISSWVGESEKLVKELFQHANNRKGQSIIFIDEIDSLCRRRNAKEEEGTRRLKTELLLQMDGQKQVLLLGATNCPWDLDTAFLRRFQQRIYIPLPDVSDRMEIMKLQCKQNATSLTESEWHDVAGKTQGYSGSDLTTLTTGAILRPIRELHKVNFWMRNGEGQWVPCAEDNIAGVRAVWSDLPSHKICPRPVTQDDFLACLSSHHSSVGREELQKYETFTNA